MMKRIFVLLLAASLALPGLAQENFSRGFEGKNKIFIPKGSLGGGLSASWRKFSLGEDEGFTVLSKLVGDLQGGYRTASVSPSFEYFLADNLSVVMRFDYSRLGVDLDKQAVFISHGDCLGDANFLADIMRDRFGVKDIVINYVGPVIGAHSGPGTVALFFLGKER